MVGARGVQTQTPNTLHTYSPARDIHSVVSCSPSCHSYVVFGDSSSSPMIKSKRLIHAERNEHRITGGN
jgi:hypothetical protein